MVSACAKISSARARKSRTRARSFRFGILRGPPIATLWEAYYHKLGRVAPPVSLFWPGCGLILVLVLVAAMRGAVFVLAIGVIGKRHADARPSSSIRSPGSCASSAACMHFSALSRDLPRGGGHAPGGSRGHDSKHGGQSCAPPQSPRDAELDQTDSAARADLRADCVDRAGLDCRVTRPRQGPDPVGQLPARRGETIKNYQTTTAPPPLYYRS